MTSSIHVRRATKTDLKDIQFLFVETIKTTCKDDYTPEQIQVWTSSVDNQQRWLDKIEKQYFLVALNGEQIVGFASLDGTDYLDYMYVHKDFQGQGIAMRLCADIEEEAIKHGATYLRTDASITARPFFEKMGFETVMENRKIIKGVEIINFAMRKEFNGSTDPAGV